MNRGINYIKGANFSGRSDFAKKESIIQNQKRKSSSIYLYEIPANSISGIMLTVQDEIQLHFQDSSEETKTSINEIIKELNFEKNLCKNPFDLSGGEQALLVILCAILLEPQKIFIDLTLEQLNIKWISPLLRKYLKGKFNHSEIYLIDNRVSEYNFNTKDIVKLPKTEGKYKFHKPSFNNLLMPYDEYGKDIEVMDLSFSYNNKEDVLKNLSINLKPGSLYHLKGINGSGKSTLSKILTGLLKHNRGVIKVENKPERLYKFPGKFVSYSFQNPDEQLFSMTVEDEILKIKRNESNKNKIRRESLIKTFGFSDIRKVNPADLPFVMRKRLSLASTIALDKSWYIFDEPTLGQDNEFLQFFINILNFLLDKKKGIILITHSKSLVSKINHNLIDLDNYKNSTVDE